jgi:hypothetical protein
MLFEIVRVVIVVLFVIVLSYVTLKIIKYIDKKLEEE